jgi:hypothetical protein
MTSYASGSVGPSVSGFDRQGPTALPKSAFGRVSTVSSSIVMENASSVIIQGVGNATFKYDCTSAEGSALLAAAFSADNTVTLTQDDSNVSIPINPCAVSASGDMSVTFVYRGGL